MRKEKKNKTALFMTIAIIFLMTFSVFGYFADSIRGKNKFNGWKIKETQNGYVLQREKQQIFSYFHPADLETINSTVELNILTLQQPVYLVFDPETESPQYIDQARLMTAEFLTDYDILVGSGVTELGEGVQLPVIDCAENQTVIKFLIGNQSRITGTNDCMTLEASYAQEIIVLVERFKLGLLGIIE